MHGPSGLQHSIDARDDHGKLALKLHLFGHQLLTGARCQAQPSGNGLVYLFQASGAAEPMLQLTFTALPGVDECLNAARQASLRAQALREHPDDSSWRAHPPGQDRIEDVKGAVQHISVVRNVEPPCAIGR